MGRAGLVGQARTDWMDRWRRGASAMDFRGRGNGERRSNGRGAGARERTPAERGEMPGRKERCQNEAKQGHEDSKGGCGGPRSSVHVLSTTGKTARAGAPVRGYRRAAPLHLCRPGTCLTRRGDMGALSSGTWVTPGRRHALQRTRPGRTRRQDSVNTLSGNVNTFGSSVNTFGVRLNTFGVRLNTFRVRLNTFGIRLNTCSPCLRSGDEGAAAVLGS